jgi:hypothetical protein
LAHGYTIWKNISCTNLPDDAAHVEELLKPYPKKRPLPGATTSGVSRYKPRQREPPRDVDSKLSPDVERDRGSLRERVRQRGGKPRPVSDALSLESMPSRVEEILPTYPKSRRYVIQNDRNGQRNPYGVSDMLP